MIKKRAYSQDAYDKFTENDKAASLKYHGGTYGGGSEVLVISYIKKPLEHCVPQIISGYSKNKSNKGN